MRTQRPPDAPTFAEGAKRLGSWPGIRPSSHPETGRIRTIDAKTLAALAAHLVDRKRAEDIQVIDVEERLKVADYFVIATGHNRTHVRALHDELHVRLKAIGQQHRPVEGLALGWWVVLDYGDVIVHLFQPEARAYYDLERLYADSPRLEWRRVEVEGLVPGSAAEV